MRLTVSRPTSLPSTLRMTSAGAPGLAIVVSTSILCLPAATFPRCEYRPLDDHHIVLVDELAIVHVERDAAACTSERIKNSGCIFAELGVDADTLLSRPIPGAANSGKRVVVASKVQLV